MKSCR